MRTAWHVRENIPSARDPTVSLADVGAEGGAGASSSSGSFTLAGAALDPDDEPSDCGLASLLAAPGVFSLCGGVARPGCEGRGAASGDALCTMAAEDIVSAAGAGVDGLRPALESFRGEINATSMLTAEAPPEPLRLRAAAAEVAAAESLRAATAAEESFRPKEEAEPATVWRAAEGFCSGGDSGSVTLRSEPATLGCEGDCCSFAGA